MPGPGQPSRVCEVDPVAGPLQAPLDPHVRGRSGSVPRNGPRPPSGRHRPEPWMSGVESLGHGDRRAAVCIASSRADLASPALGLEQSAWLQDAPTPLLRDAHRDQPASTPGLRAPTSDFPWVRRPASETRRRGSKQGCRTTASRRLPKEAGGRPRQNRRGTTEARQQTSKACRGASYRRRRVLGHRRGRPRGARAASGSEQPIGGYPTRSDIVRGCERGPCSQSVRARARSSAVARSMRPASGLRLLRHPRKRSSRCQPR